MALSYVEVLVLSAGSKRTTKEVEVVAGDCASLARKFETCLRRGCANVLCSGNVRTGNEDDRVQMVEYTVNVTEGEAEKTTVKTGLLESGDGKLVGLQSEVARSF